MSKDRRGQPGSTDPASLRTVETEVIPLVEERLSVSKREVERGRVRVHVKVRERDEVVRQELTSDNVSIQRVPQNVRLTAVPEIRTEGSTTIIPVVEEVLITEKVLMLVEEIHINRDSTSAVRELPITLRSEHAQIERDADGENVSAPAGRH